MTTSERLEPAFCVVMHDVAPATWAKCQVLLRALREVAPFPATLLVVPQYHHGRASAEHRDFCKAMSDCIATGDELVLHGMYHQDDVPARGLYDLIKRRFYTASEGEFATLSRDDAAARIQSGMRWFEDEGWPVHGFVAPAWLISQGSWTAMRDAGLCYTTTLRGLHLLDGKTSLNAQSLVFSSRSQWRRAVSHIWADVLSARLTHAPVVRFGLHPIDADYPAVVAHWQRLLEKFAKTHHGSTKFSIAQQLMSAGTGPRIGAKLRPI